MRDVGRTYTSVQRQIGRILRQLYVNNDKLFKQKVCNLHWNLNGSNGKGLYPCQRYSNRGIKIEVKLKYCQMSSGPII